MKINLLSGLIVFLLATSMSFASYLDVESVDDSVLPGELASYKITITNRDSLSANFSLRIDGYGRDEWVTLENKDFFLGSNESDETMLYLNVPYEYPYGNYEFDIVLLNKDNASEVERRTIAVYVQKTYQLQLLNVSVEKEEYESYEDVRVFYKVKNIGTLESVPMKMKIEVSNGNEIQTKEEAIEPLKINEVKRSSIVFSFDPLRARGSYTVKGVLLDQYDEPVTSSSDSFTILEKPRMSYNKSVDYGFLVNDVTLTAVNNGNAKGEAVLEDKIVAAMSFYDFGEKEPEVVDVKGRNILRWKCDLNPGERCSVTYRVDYTLIPVVLIIAIGILLYLYYYLQKPRVLRFSSKKDGKFNVYVHVKNRSRKDLEDVEITEDVPGILEFIEPDEGVVPTKVRKTGKGTQVSWIFRKLRPKEERVVSYKLKPRLSVLGGIDLPKTKVSARTQKGKIIKNKSRKHTIK